MVGNDDSGEPESEHDELLRAIANASRGDAPSSGPTLVPGTVVAGKLRVVQRIGSGGMGVVYEVEHELTKHRRALKVLHARFAHQANVLERFLREASAAARVGNAHVAETYDAGRLESGEPYLLMELVVGETFDRRLARLGPMNPGDLADWIHQACEGIQAAHEAGIIHRDLKPENLMLTVRDGAPFVKILDFGISKFDTERTGTLAITAEGLMMGTPYYMSPEQVRGGPVIDGRSDVYSLGVILYECACGARPYDAKALETLAVLIHVGETVPLAQRRPSLPPDFCAVVHRAMAKDRDQRFHGARDLGEALAPLRHRIHRTPVARTLPEGAAAWPSPRPMPPPLGGASAVLVSTDAALSSTKGSAPPPRRRSRALPMAVAVGLVALFGAVAIGRFGRAPSVPPTPAARAVTNSEATSPATVVLAPRPAAPGTDRMNAPALDAGLVSPPRRDHAPPFLGPAAPPTGRSRVEQTGLAGENPFR